VKILLTGIAGFIGHSAASKLLNEGAEIVGIDNLNDYYDVDLKYSRLKNLGIINNSNDWVSTDSKLKFIKGDICDSSLWENLKDYNFDLVINFAAQAGVRFSIENPEVYVKTNVLGFQKVLDFCVSKGINRLLYASSSSVYGNSNAAPLGTEICCNNPESLYAATKIANEVFSSAYFNLYKLSSIGLRFFTVYGPWGRPDMAPMLFSNALCSNKEITLFNNGNLKRDFTYIDDITDGILLTIRYLMEPDFSNAEVLNLGKGEPSDLIYFIQLIEKNFGRQVNKRMLPMQKGDVLSTFCDNALTNRMTGFSPSWSLEDGINEFVKWYKDYYNVK
jgi:UDP-glucuronate 4-epimerase